jgi:hypothetical protein
MSQWLLREVGNRRAGGTWALAKDDRDQSLAKLLGFPLVSSKPSSVSLVPLCASEIATSECIPHLAHKSPNIRIAGSKKYES